MSYSFFCSYDNVKIKYRDNEKIYPGSEEVILSNMSDPLFSDSEYAYNSELAKESLKLSVCAFSANVSEHTWGENSYVGREDNVKEYLMRRGFGDIEFYNYTTSLNDSSSKVAFALAYKPYDLKTNIVAIVIRGGNYGLEWADNFNLGDSLYPYHRGFHSASLDVKNISDNYLKKHSSGKKNKLWICGYSRGGAVANIVASMYNEEKPKFPCSVYAYTFASPKTSIVSETKAHDTIHKNIFNILSPNDPVYNVPPKSWGFGRFGICVVFPDNNDSDYSGAEELTQKVSKSYLLKTGEILQTTGNPVSSFIDIFIKSSKSRDFFDKKLSPPVIDFLKVKMTREKNAAGLWQTPDSKAALSKLYGKDALDVLENIKNSDFYAPFRKLGLNIPEDAYIFIALCYLNGFSEFEKTIFSEINVNDLGQVSTINSGTSIETCHSSEFYMSWLENAELSHLKFIKE